MTLKDLGGGKPLKDPDQIEAKKMLADLLAKDEGLTDWEVQFVESLSRWIGDFTANQLTRLEELWNKNF